MSANQCNQAHPDLLETAIRAATDRVFETMLGIETQPGPRFTTRNAPGPENGVVALVGLAGQFVGSGSLACSAELACKLSSALLLAECEAVNEEVLDAVAEITNMIVGNVKSALEEQFGPMGMSIPTVIFGQNFSARAIGKSEWIVVPFNVWCGRFEVQMCLAPHRQGIVPRRPGVASIEPVCR
jgi:chemotaxis protein CheX